MAEAQLAGTWDDVEQTWTPSHDSLTQTAGASLTVTVTVQDNGPGFDPHSIDRIFEPYVSSKEKGTGLGLAICRRIIEEHGGTIRANNPQQGGAAVIISLPLRRH